MEPIIGSYTGSITIRGEVVDTSTFGDDQPREFHQPTVKALEEAIAEAIENHPGLAGVVGLGVRVSLTRTDE